MKLKAVKRAIGKSDLGRIRRKGDIPGVVYHGGKENTTVTIDGPMFQAHLRAIQKGCLATTRFEVDLDGETFQAIVKDISYHRTTYNIEHIDLMKVTSDQIVTVHVPIVCKGVDTCIGITQGGQLKTEKRSVKISLKVKEMPEAFTLDVSPLSLGESIRVRDLVLTGDMKAKIDGNQILVTVSK